MTDENILESIKEFLQKNVASKFKLEKPPEDGDIDKSYDLVNPAVYIGWIPPKNFLTDYGHNVPALLIMEDGGDDTGDVANLDIRIGIATYDPGFTSKSNEKLNTLPNFKGYKDLLNIIQRIRIELSQISVLENATSIQKPISWGMYEEQQYPYWHGWVSFKASTMPLNYQGAGIEKFL